MAFHRGDSVFHPGQQWPPRRKHRPVIRPPQSRTVPERTLAPPLRDRGQRSGWLAGIDDQSGRSSEAPLALWPRNRPAVVKPPTAVDVLLRTQAAPGPRLARDERPALSPPLDDTAVQGCTWLCPQALDHHGGAFCRRGVEPTPHPGDQSLQFSASHQITAAPGMAHGVSHDSARRS